METLNAKQEAIKKAYGEYWETVKDKVTDDGFAPYVLLENSIGIMFQFRTFIIADCNPEIHVRPISLQGIKNNNGWIRIESEEDLPKEEIDLHFIFEKNNGRFQTFGVWDNKIKSFYSGALKISNVTHYQPIEKPKLPIY